MQVQASWGGGGELPFPLVFCAGCDVLLQSVVHGATPVARRCFSVAAKLCV